MSDNDATVLLITADAALADTIERRRPPECRLEVRNPKDPPLCDQLARQCWIDLDSDPDINPPPARRYVYFHSSTIRSPADRPTGVFVPKRSLGLLLDVLWADAEVQPGVTTAEPTTDTHGTLPAWATDFQVLRLAEFYRLCVHHLPPRLGYRRGSLYIHDPERRVLVLAGTNHDRPLDVAVSMDDGSTHLMVAAALSGEMLQLDGARREKSRRLVPHTARDSAYDNTSCLIAPLMSRGNLRGVLNLSGRVSGTDSQRGVSLPVLLRFLGRALEHAQLHEQACTEARVDALTGLFNHRWMIESLESEIRRAQRFEAPLSVLLIDVDRLKVVNDMHGHAAGDMLLRHMSAKISAQLRRFDAAARIGGDEFVVMLPGTGAAGAEHVGDRILQSVRSDTLRFRDVVLPTTASLGFAEWIPDWQAQQLIEAADHAMYRAKQQGRNRVACHIATAPAPNIGVTELRPATTPARSPLPDATHHRELPRL